MILDAILGPVTGVISDILKRVLPAEKMSESDRLNLEAQLSLGLMKADLSTAEQQVKVLVAEMEGNWLQRSWRPILMLSIVAIIVNNYILFPYLSLFTTKVVMLSLPEQLWSLMEIGVGGYVASRGLEKITKTWKGTPS